MPPESVTPHKDVIEPGEVRQRVDSAVANRLPSVSRAFIKKLIGEERIKVNGMATKPGYRLRKDDTLDILFHLDELEKIEPIDLPVLYEDDDVLVINKPSGVISHARGKFWNEPSVASFLRDKTHLSGERAGIVHRLDRATSGIMICSKNQNALSVLQGQFADRSVSKVYNAVIEGTLDPEEAIIDMPIERNPSKPQTFRVGEAGKSAQTRYKVIKRGKDFSLLELTPLTGRTHQLRVHLHARKHPIVGDELYGGKKAERLLLHALSLEVSLPSGERKKFVAPLPSLFDDLVNV